MHPKLRIGWVRGLVGLPVALMLAAAPWGCGSGNGNSTSMTVLQTNLVSDQAGKAPVIDPNLVNPWGMALSSQSPLWVANNHSGTSTLYNGSGQPFPVGMPLVVTIPLPPGSAGEAVAAPTGLVFNFTGDFIISQGATSGPSAFIFSTEDGTLAGWNQNVNLHEAILTVDNSEEEAIYKGLALATSNSVSYLYATNFHAGRVDVFDGNFQSVELAGSFTDPNIPAGYAPFGIATSGGQLYITYAKQDEDKEDDVKGPGNGYVDVFNTDGTFVKRFASQGTLNSPWGIAFPPNGFNGLGADVLIGNFGDGRINVFAVNNGAFLGQLNDGVDPIMIDGLWSLVFGNGSSNGGDSNTLFFTAGPDDESHGLFGSLEPM